MEGVKAWLSADESTPAPLVPTGVHLRKLDFHGRCQPSCPEPLHTGPDTNCTLVALPREASELQDRSAKLTIKVCLDTMPDTTAEGGERPWYDSVLPRGGDTHLLGRAEVPLADLASGAAAGVRHQLRGGQEGAWAGRGWGSSRGCSSRV